MQSITRKQFLGTGAAAAAGTAAAGVAIASAEETPAVTPSWRDAPAPIPADQISQELTADVIVIGAGHAGSSVARAAAEGGATVILVEEQPEDFYMLFGHEYGGINSKYMVDVLGYDPVDRAECYNDWMARNAYRANPAFVRTYVDRSGDTFDWLVDILDQDFIDAFSTNGLPGPYNYSGEQNCQKAWPSSVEMQDAVVVHRAQQQAMLACSPQNTILWGTSGEQLVREGDRVVAAIVSDADGNYLRLNANKGVVVATGGFAGNEEMCRDIYWNILNMFPASMRDSVHVSYPMLPRMGKGHQMCVWAGAAWEPEDPAWHAVCNPSGGNPFNIVKSSLSNLWLNAEGKRYTNEGGDFQLAGLEGRFQPMNEDGTVTVYSIMDSSLLDDLQYQQAGHGASCINDGVVGEEVRERIERQMAATVEAGDAGYVTEGFMGAAGYTAFAADTIEQLADRLGVTGEAKENFVASVARYNELCEAGYDDDFFKDASLMLPIAEPPYFGYRVDNALCVGLTTMTGMWTDDNQCCLDDLTHKPIQGLYATGNVCGRRWVGQYTTSIAGQSVAMAITMGRVLGEHLASL